jgi:hypothetical protein
MLLVFTSKKNAFKMREGPEIKRGVGRMREGAFDFLELFGSFWGNAKKNGTFEVKLKFNFDVVLRSEVLFQQTVCGLKFLFSMTKIEKKSHPMNGWLMISLTGIFIFLSARQIR